jgi:hypothetical protein
VLGKTGFGRLQLDVSLNELFGKGCRRRTAVAHVSARTATAIFGSSTGANATNQAWSRNFFGMSFSGPLRSAAVCAVPVFPPIVTSGDFALPPVPSVTTAANASLINFSVSGFTFNLAFVTTGNS